MRRLFRNLFRRRRSSAKRADQENVLYDLRVYDEGKEVLIPEVRVSEYGIFLILHKSGKGIITGTEFSDRWKRKEKGHVYSFLNPMKVNYANMKVLKRKVDLPISCFHLITVFDDHAEIQIDLQGTAVHESELEDTIAAWKEKVIADPERIVELLKQNNTEMLCPECGGRLIRRKGRNGEFLGCENFPSCRHTERLKNDE